MRRVRFLDRLELSDKSDLALNKKQLLAPSFECNAFPERQPNSPGTLIGFTHDADMFRISIHHPHYKYSGIVCECIHLLLYLLYCTEIL